MQRLIAKFAPAGAILTIAGATALHYKDNIRMAIPKRVNEKSGVNIRPEDFTQYQDFGGRSAPTKIKLHGHKDQGAFAKSLPAESVYRDVIKARVVEYTFTKLFGPGTAPKSYVGVSYDTFKARLFNTVDAALKTLGVVKQDAAPYGSLFSISTVIGDTKSLSASMHYLRTHNLLEKSKGDNVRGFGVSLLLSNVLSGDPNAGNIIESFYLSNSGEDSSMAYPIDGEVDPTDKILFFQFDGNEDAKQKCFDILRAGWLTEAMSTEEQRVNTLLAKTDPIGFAETKADPDRVYSKEEIYLIADMMLHDVQNGLLEQAYKTLAELDKAKLYAITEDLGIPESDREEIIANVIMPRITEIQEHLVASAEKSRSRSK
jgi:hypothetical protein